MKKIIILILIIVTSNFVQCQIVEKKSGTQSKFEQEVILVHKERLNALSRGDVSTLDRIVGADLIYVSPRGKVQSKQEIVSDMKSGKLKVNSIIPLEMNVRVFGNTAVVNYFTDTKFVDNGNDYNTQIRATSVYVKRQKQWQLVSQQMTRVEP